MSLFKTYVPIEPAISAVLVTEGNMDELAQEVGGWVEEANKGPRILCINHWGSRGNFAVGPGDVLIKIPAGGFRVIHHTMFDKQWKVNDRLHPREMAPKAL